jgi:uncharacterized protein (UPF0548 family)
MSSVMATAQHSYNHKSRDTSVSQHVACWTDGHNQLHNWAASHVAMTVEHRQQTTVEDSSNNGA